jgi:hypothetical protein
MSKLLGLTPCTFSRKINGKSKWTLEEINKALEIFSGSTIPYLFKRTNGEAKQ